MAIKLNRMYSLRRKLLRESSEAQTVKVTQVISQQSEVSILIGYMFQGCCPLFFTKKFFGFSR